MRRSLASLPAGLCLAALLALAGCAVNPATGDRELSLMSEGQEVELGRSGDVSAIGEYGVVADAALGAYVNRVGQRLAAVSERSDLQWHFRVLDSPVVNAFALPGGYIYVTRGMLAMLQSEAQLAGVMGHEIGHVTARHGARQMTRQQLAGLGLGLGSVFIKEVGSMASVLNQGLGLLFLKYSRGDETQADELGVRYATRAGYDPREIPPTYVMLQRLSERSGQHLPAFLSTHPDPGGRAERTAELARLAVGTRKDLEVGRTPHLNRLEGLVYGEDPRQGFLEGGVFYHPELRFQVRFPAAWKVTNARSSVTALAGSGQAGMRLELAQAPAGTRAGSYPATLVREGKVSSTRGGELDIHGHAAWLGSVFVPSESGAPSEVLAGWIEGQGGVLLQWTGGPAADPATRGAFRSAVESFEDLRDPVRLNPAVSRLQLRSAPGGQTVGAVHKLWGDVAVGVEEFAWLNGLEERSTPERGALLKVPVRK